MRIWMFLIGMTLGLPITAGIMVVLHYTLIGQQVHPNCNAYIDENHIVHDAQPDCWKD